MNAQNTGHDLANDGNKTTHDVMQDFAGHLLTVREEERRHLANEIHDKLGQNLLALRIDVSRLHAWTQDRHPRINGRTTKLLVDLDVALRNVRDILNLLRPPVIELGLLASVEWKVHEFETQNKIACALLIDNAESDYAAYDGHAVPVMRILHEALTNVVHHAGASSAEVRLSCSGQQLTIQVIDDGIGISPEDLRKSNVYGLVGVMKYARMLNGECFIHSDGEQSGTALTVAFPPPPVS